MNKEKAFSFAAALASAAVVLWAIAMAVPASPVPAVPPVPAPDMRADPGVAVPVDLDRRPVPGRPLFERAEAWTPVTLQPLAPPDLPPPPVLSWPGEAEGSLSFPRLLEAGRAR